MIREATVLKLETKENPPELLRGLTYTTQEGLPGFPEAREFAVHHTEQVAGQTIVWFSGPNHSLDYAILKPGDTLEAGQKEDEEAFDYPQKHHLQEILTKKGLFTINIDPLDESTNSPVRKLLTALYRKGGYFRGSPTITKNSQVAFGTTKPQTKDTTPEAENTEPKNYQPTRLLSFGRDLLVALAEDENNSAKAAEFAKALRLMILAEKKFQRTAPVMPEGLWQPEQYADPKYQEQLKNWLKLYYNSAYSDLPDHNDSAELLKRSGSMPENSSREIITEGSTLPQQTDDTNYFSDSPQKSSNQKNKKYLISRFQSLMANLRLQASQTTETLSFSPTFNSLAFNDPFYNNTKEGRGLTARIKPTSELLGSFVVALNGIELPDPLPEPKKEETEEGEIEKTKPEEKKKKGTLDQRVMRGLQKFIRDPQRKVIKRPPHQYHREASEEFVGSGPESRISFYFKNPVGPDGSNIGRVPYNFEIFCPKTKNAETVKNLLLQHPDVYTRKFYKSLDENNYLTVSGDHHLLCKITDDFSPEGIQKIYGDNTKEWKEGMQSYQRFLNPIKVLSDLGCLDPESSAHPNYSRASDDTITKALENL